MKAITDNKDGTYTFDGNRYRIITEKERLKFEQGKIPWGTTCLAFLPDDPDNMRLLIKVNYGCSS